MFAFGSYFGSYETNILIYMFLESRNTKGNNTTKVIMMLRKDCSMVVPKKTKETIKAAIPTATFNP